MRSIVNTGRVLALALLSTAVVSGAATPTADAESVPETSGTGTDPFLAVARAGISAAFGATSRPGYHALYGVAAISPTDALTAGTGGSRDTARSRHWTGDLWMPTHPPGRKRASTFMYGVAAMSSSDAWMVGTTQGRALMAHWDGSEWTRNPPDQPATLDYVAAVSGHATDDVWAVGYSLVGERFDEVPLIEHWDGDGWTKVPLGLPDGVTFGKLNSVSVVSADGAWAVGTTCCERTAPLFLHWDGRKWTSVDDPTEPAEYKAPYAVDAVAADDVWVVGAAGERAGCLRWPTLLHWDGDVWTEFESPTHE
jgi:hypothetical protein